MSSVAFQDWSTVRASSLDEIEHAHRAVGGTGPGRRYVTQQINQAYAVLLSSQFQGFCRDLHTECADHLVAAITPVVLRNTLRNAFLLHRRLDRGNPNPANLGADYDRLGLTFWVEVITADARNAQRRQALEALNAWRNAIAHQDFIPAMLRTGRPVLQLSQVQGWRRACDNLAKSFDGVMGSFVQRMTGVAPW
jgi:hypothetical protein